MEQARIPDRYRLIEEVGQGGMAVVYRAQDETLKREVAIKILHQHLASEPESKARLEREAQAVAKLHHENILEIFDYSGLESPSSYIVTEFIEGQTLKQFLADREVRFPEIAAMIAVEICGALQHAHALGIIHRDVKPENVMIRTDGLIKLMDFGIAQILDLERMTVTGQLLGSPAYMAPEIVEGKRLDFRTDVFSVGIVLYLLATGALPFSGKNPHEVLRRITEGKFTDPRSVGRGVDQALARIITRALARQPDDRYPDVAPLADDLRGYLADGGLTDIRSELRDYFSSPAAYEAALPSRLSAGLTAAAERQLSNRRRARALELWNRVLAFDPQNAAVAVALRKLEGRARLRLAGLVLLGVGAAAGLVVAFSSLLSRVSHRGAPLPASAGATTAAPPSESGRSPAGATAPPSPPAAAGAEHVDDGVEPPSATSGAARARTSRLAAAKATSGGAAKSPTGAPRSAAARVFTLGPTPKNVDVYLDGELQFGYDVDHTTIAVPWTGVHVIELKSPSGCCFSERIEVGPDRPLPADAIIARRLRWRPAHLVLATDPPTPGTHILVRDPAHLGAAATSGRPGEEIDVPFFPEDDSSKEIEIAVDAGDAFATEHLRVRAGERLKHVVKLKTSGN